MDGTALREFCAFLFRVLELLLHPFRVRLFCALATTTNEFVLHQVGLEFLVQLRVITKHTKNSQMSFSHKIQDCRGNYLFEFFVDPAVFVLGQKGFLKDVDGRVEVVLPQAVAQVDHPLHMFLVVLRIRDENPHRPFACDGERRNVRSTSQGRDVKSNGEFMIFVSLIAQRWRPRSFNPRKM